ncbi:hypothetical protein CJD38_14295 [Stenotrophobium rhamnosiphilum]|uniref:WW domain-containing protein n=2 Tax=Stenotrophobium rhamnosiphilum TaxID=2029166 RepID=A0A2T5MDY1_9GAMM|nr:hypothetical protein CJD38_14295 [Stenotrophobium rhamnosiphilum]
MYWPGLYGSYLFDDYPNIVNNTDLQISALTVPDVTRAALSSPSSEFKRPLASLSFSANYFLTGLNPFWMKLTNLLIHLLNGVLTYTLALALIRNASSHTATTSNARDPRWIALWISAAWLLLPINLTAVLYVVQRMESLANLFVLLGLVGYVHARQQMQTSNQGFVAAVGSLLLASSLGLLSKETAVMTPLYAATIEWALFGARSANQRRDYRIIALFLIVLAIPLVIGLIWQLPRLLNSGAWANRNFDLPQRLLTEARIVVDYIHWTLLPTPKALSFYHDDYLVSTGWLKPWTTLLCAFILAALTALVIGLRKRAPLISLGLGLFLGGQLLTATILPLELVYEHRNYFASFGLLLALIPLLTAGSEHLPAASARYILLGGLLSLWAVVTISTASAWGSPLILSQTLAERAPNSPRAQYGLGYTYIVLSKYDRHSSFTTAAYAPLEKAMRLPNASILPEQALIMMNARMQQPIKIEWWDSLAAKLKARKASSQDEGSLEALAKCAEKAECIFDQGPMLQAFLAALSHPYPSARLLAIYGTYAWNVMGDRTLGEKMLAEAVALAPSQTPYRITLAKMLILQGRKNDADQEIAKLELLNLGGRLNADMAALRSLPETP